MRYIGLLIIFVSIPILMAWLNQNTKKNRKIAIICVGLLLFFTGPLQINAALMTKIFWQGTSKGMLLSLLDSFAVALYLTNRERKFKKPFMIIITLFSIPIFLSIFFAFDKQAAMFIAFQIVQLSFFYIAISQELVRPGYIHALLKGMSLGLILNALFVVNQKLHGAVQAPGLTVHQNITGIMVELTAIPILAAVLDGGKSKLYPAGLVAALVIIAGGGSRGTMIFFSIGAILTIILSLLRFPTPRKWKVIGTGGLLVAVVAPLALLTIGERFGAHSVITKETVRTDFNKAAKMMAHDHPFGVGSNNYVIVNNVKGYAARAGLPWGGTTRQAPAHNAFLLSRAETGWAGEITLILLLGGVATAGYRLTFKLRKRPVIGLSIGAATAVTVVAFHSNYEFAWWLSDVQRIFFTDMAIIAACAEIARREVRDAKRTLKARRSKKLHEERYPDNALGEAVHAPS